MKRNIFLKSISRQPIRTILLILLVALSAFALTMRGAEYLTVTENIREIGGYYRAIGMLRNMDETDVELLRGADWVAQSPYVDFEDRRRGFVGVLQGMTNSDIGPMWCPYLTVDPTENNDVFFYGTLARRSVEEDSSRYNPWCFEEVDRIVLTVLVDDVLTGHPEHAIAGQQLQLRFYPEGIPEYNRFCTYPPLAPGNEVLDSLEVGQRYFFRGVYYNAHEIHLIPRTGPAIGQNDALIMRPLNERTVYHSGQRNRFRELKGEAIWYISAEPGEIVDSAMPGLEQLSEELAHLSFRQSFVRLMTTADMTAIPFVQTEEKRLFEGRWIDQEDVLAARPVAVVSSFFGRMRGIHLGDTLTIAVPSQQAIPRVLNMRCWGSMMYRFLHISPPQEEFDTMLELEVVGFYHYSNRASFLADPVSSTVFSTFVYMPDSLLPPDFSYEYAVINDGFYVWMSGESHLINTVPGVDIQYQGWYSFVLRDTRDEDAFMLENEDVLRAMGIRVGFIPTNAKEFWESAEGILLVVSFNLLTFSAFAALTLVLIGFLYMRQSRKDFAILRALGSSKRQVLRQYIVTVFLFGLPAALIGSVGGWFFALRQADNTLNPLGDIVPYVEINPTLPIYWLFAFAAVIFACLLTIVVLWGMRMGQRPVLELLQGNAVRKRGL